MGNWDMPRITPESNQDEKEPAKETGILGNFNNKTVGKFIAGAAFIAAAAGGIQESYACEKNDKPATGQTSTNKDKDFFNTTTPEKPPVPGICFVGGIKEEPVVINHNAAEIVEITNINKKESHKPGKINQSGNKSTILIGEQR